MTEKNLLRSAQQWDKARPGFPGEHWLVFGAGVLLMHRSGLSRHWVGRTLGRAAGAALVARAASGQDGVLGKLGALLAPQRPGSRDERTIHGTPPGDHGTPAAAADATKAAPTQATGPYPTAANSAQNG